MALFDQRRRLFTVKVLLLKSLLLLLSSFDFIQCWSVDVHNLGTVASQLVRSPPKRAIQDYHRQRPVSWSLAVREFIRSSPSPRFNVVYRAARLQHCWGRKGAAYSRKQCQRIFVPSQADLGVPKTFVVYCRSKAL